MKKNTLLFLSLASKCIESGANKRRSQNHSDPPSDSLAIQTSSIPVRGIDIPIQ